MKPVTENLISESSGMEVREELMVIWVRRLRVKQEREERRLERPEQTGERGEETESGA